jgi:asparagine synthase (glutamine-hydrolysing)
MPGIVGIIGKSSDDYKRMVLDKMCESVMHEPWHKVDKYIDSGIAIGRVHINVLNKNKQPFSSKDGSLIFFMEGEIYGCDELMSELKSMGYELRFNTDEEIIIYLYLAFGEDFVSRLNGNFIIVIWDKINQKIVIVNDRYGFRNLFYTISNGYLLIGSEVKAIIQDQEFIKKVNDTAISDFFSFGFLLGNKTFFKGIELLPPATVFVYNNGRTHLKTYWKVPTDELSMKSNDEYYEEFTVLFLKAIQKNMKGDHRFGLSLSGGLDSRAVAAGAIKNGLHFNTYTFGDVKSEEFIYAAQVAKVLEVKHNCFMIDPSYLIQFANKAVKLTDGMCSCMHSHGISIFNQLKENTDVELCGMETIFNYLHLKELSKFKERYYSNKNDEMIFERIFGSLSKNDKINAFEIRKKLFSDEYYKKIKDLPMQSFDEIRSAMPSDLKDASPFKKIDYYSLTQRQRRHTLYGEILIRSQVEVRLPLFENDLFDFVLRLPERFRVEEKLLYIKGIFQLYPALLSIPNANNGLPLNANFVMRDIEKIKGLSQRYLLAAVRRINMALNKKNTFRPQNKKPLADYNYWFRTNSELRDFTVQTILSKEAKSRPYFNFTTIASLLDRHFKGLDYNAELIGRLLTFEIWNRQFID